MGVLARVDEGGSLLEAVAHAAQPPDAGVPLARIRSRSLSAARSSASALGPRDEDSVRADGSGRLLLRP